MIDDDAELWNAVKNTVKPIQKKSRADKLTRPVYVMTFSESERIARIAFQQKDYQRSLKTQKEVASAFKKKHIQARIDLHGMTCAQAEQKLQHFFVKASCIGNSIVLVITGKGKPSEEVKYNDDYALGALRDFTIKWFDANPQWIVSYAQALNKDGGLGAFYVHVRRQK
jgi:DNA-nicking Smr family endonuclease